MDNKATTPRALPGPKIDDAALERESVLESEPESVRHRLGSWSWSRFGSQSRSRESAGESELESVEESVQVKVRVLAEV